MPKHKVSLTVGLAIVFVTAFGAGTDTVSAADWPMWRYNSGRHANSPENLPQELALQWTHTFTPRETVWDDPLNQDLMPYDRAFEPIVVGKTLFIGFNDSDKVLALDTDTGKERWRFYTDGPVRLPLAAWKDQIFFTSDDGHLYCLAARDGKLLWKFQGGPTDRRILGNKRLISTWPARGGAVIEDGVVYFAASIWPFMGTFIYAIDAASGAVVWENSGNGATYMLQPHNSPAFAGVAPQGALVVSGDKLLVPGGRSVAACFDRQTGRYLYYHLAENGKSGGSFVCAIGNLFFNHHREKETSLYEIENGDTLIGMIGKQPVLTDTAWYFMGDKVRAFDPSKTLADRKKWREGLLWEVEVNASGDLIKAGNRLYAAGDGRITAIDVENPASPLVAWSKVVEGSVERLIAANGKLFAVTLDGRILAFAKPRRLTHPLTIQEPVAAVEPTYQLNARASRLLDQTGIRAGYALYYSPGNGDFLGALLSNSDLHIIAIEPDSARVRALRRKFDGLGLSGCRVAVFQGEPATFDTPPYLSSLTILGESVPLDTSILEKLHESLRPYNGTLFSLGQSTEEFSRIASRVQLENVEVSSQTPSLFRKGPLPGAGHWTNQYGSMANSAKSDDALVSLPLGILWFGGNSNLDVLPRHGHGPPEKVIGGRLFIQGMDCLSARDVYTGRVIWKIPLQDMNTYGIYYDGTYKDTPTSTKYNQVHLPGANIRGTNFVATADRVYVVQGSQCDVLDASSGEIMTSVVLPPIDPEAQTHTRRQWAFIGVEGNTLFGGNGFVPFSDLTGLAEDEYSIWTDFDTGASRELIAFDRFSGSLRWRFDQVKHGLLHNAIAAGNSTVFFLDKLPPHIEKHLGRRGQTIPSDYRLTALDMNTGTVRWQKTSSPPKGEEGDSQGEHSDLFGSFLSYSVEHDILIQSTRPSRDMVKDEDGKRMMAYRGSDGSLLWDATNTYATFPILHGDKIITEGRVFSLLTGEPLDMTSPITGEQLRWTWKRDYGCNYPIACENFVSFRSAAAGYYDLEGQSGTGHFGGFKSGCTANLIAADGVLNAPDYTRTCSCSYQNQTSLAMLHMTDNEAWTFTTLERGSEPIERLGINLGAPGDRVSETGTIWLEYPIQGGPSPKLVVSVSPEHATYFRVHSSRIPNKSMNWVFASGVRDLTRLGIHIGNSAPRKYKVRLYFCEPQDASTSRTVFDVALQGETVLTDFDLYAQSGWLGIVKEFSAVSVAESLDISFNSQNQKGTILSGVEIIAEE